MTVILKTVDQVPGAPTVDGPELSFQVGQVTVREIIRARVTREVERHNSEREPRKFAGLVQPPAEEQQPNNQYLCIVRDRAAGSKQVRLPFEGDDTLSIILSKAFMLADDDKIKDVSINSQIRGG